MDQGTRKTDTTSTTTPTSRHRRSHANDKTPAPTTTTPIVRVSDSNPNRAPANTTAARVPFRLARVSAQSATESCEERYARDVRRWQSLDEVATTVLPKALSDFREERDRILELIPTQTREEVASYINELADATARGFQVLRDETENVLLELEIAQLKLDRLGARTDSIGEHAESISLSIENSLRESAEARQRIRKRVSDLVDRVHDFDAEYINDRSSSDRLRLNRRQRETIKAFHDDVVSSLAGLSESSEP